MLFIVILLSLTIALFGFLGLYDGIQLLVDLPRSFSYFVFTFRVPFVILGLVSFGAALYLGQDVLPLPFWIGYILIFLFLFLGGYVLQPYIMFRPQQHTARYISVPDAGKLLDDSAELLVIIQQNGVAAFPHEWISRSRIAGVQLGQEKVIMTYCILAHLGMAFKESVDGKKLKLRVLNQIENNLVLFDERSQSLIEHIYGVFAKSRKPLIQVPSTVMTFGSFRTLFPGGQVFFSPPSLNPIDSFVRRTQNKLLYGSGGYMNPANSDAAYPTIAYADQRIPAKERIYGISLHNEAAAYTLEHVKAAGDTIVTKLGGQTITLKYFSEYRFLDVFWGEVPQVDPKGYTPDGTYQRRVPHANQVLWIIWSHFYPHSELKN